MVVHSRLLLGSFVFLLVVLGTRFSWAQAPDHSSGEQQPAQGGASPGWSLAGAILGFSTAPLVLGLGIGSEVTTDSLPLALSLGATAWVATAALVPLVASAARSARAGANARGCRGCLISSWITYGVANIGWPVLAVVTAIEGQPRPAVLAVMAAFAATSLCLMAGHAMAARRQAVGHGEQQQLSAERALFSWSLFAAPTTTDDSISGAVGGVVFSM